MVVLALLDHPYLLHVLLHEVLEEVLLTLAGLMKQVRLKHVVPGVVSPLFVVLLQARHPVPFGVNVLAVGNVVAHNPKQGRGEALKKPLLHYASLGFFCCFGLEQLPT